jgi:MinD superfamily P-loop ATPase
MQIAVASGKGGTGKTTVATNLARVASQSGRNVAYLDCDVEDPNGHLFLRPEIDRRASVGEPVPQVDLGKCNGCGKCSEICQYGAIVCAGKSVLVYADLCHSCGGCTLVCPVGAIAEFPHRIGTVEEGRSGPLRFRSGTLDVGKARAVPVIRAVKSGRPAAEVTILDAPPGTSCPVVETVRGTDFAVLVAEPTPFGFHDLKLTLEMMEGLEVPCGVVINRAASGDGRLRAFCESRGIPVLGEIPDDRRLAEAYSRGRMACDALPEYRTAFAGLLDAIIERAAVLVA